MVAGLAKDKPKPVGAVAVVAAGLAVINHTKKMLSVMRQLSELIVETYLYIICSTL